MTRSEITQEPFELLDRPPETKKDVTYVLVQIRKVLEHDKRREGYSGLKFFCDWSLHTKLDWKGAKEVRHSTNVLDTTAPRSLKALTTMARLWRYFGSDSLEGICCNL
jgi:hypothetical protein